MFEMNAPVITGFLFSGFCIWLLMHGLRSYKKALDSLHWPGTRGEISKLELWGKRNINGQVQDAEKLSVDYHFAVNGKTFQGSRLAFYTLMYPETVNFANANPAKSHITVYYDPNNPDNCVLIPGSRSGNKRYSDIVIASIGLIVSIGITILGALGKIG